jgi:hypothetical protein
MLWKNIDTGKKIQMLNNDSCPLRMAAEKIEIEVLYLNKKADN